MPRDTFCSWKPEAWDRIFGEGVKLELPRSECSGAYEHTFINTDEKYRYRCYQGITISDNEPIVVTFAIPNSVICGKCHWDKKCQIQEITKGGF